MKDGDVKKFIEDIHYEDHALLYKDRKYFFNGCSYHLDKYGKKVFSFEIFDDDSGETIYSVQDATAEGCIEEFLSAKLFDGKTFYEVEKEMTQIDW